MNAPWDLIDGYLDGQLASEQEVQFQDWLKSDPEHLRCFVREVHLHQSLRAELQALRAVPAVLPLPRAIEESAPAPFPQRSRKIFPLHWKPVLALAASIALVAAALELFLPHTAEPVLSGNFAGSLEVKRGVEILRPSSGFKPQPNDFFALSGTNSASLTYTSENTQIEFAPGSQWKVLPWSRGKQFELLEGELHAAVASQPFGKPMILRTSHAGARVIGTRFTLLENTNLTRLDVAEGKVRLTRVSDGAMVKVGAGNYAVVAVNYELAALPATGRILREYWTNYSIVRHEDAFFAAMTSDSNFSEHPQGWDYITRFETPPSVARLGERIRGYVHPPRTGEYRFSIFNTGSGEAFLFLSPDDNPENRVQIVDDYTTPRGVGFGISKSAPFPLVAGRRDHIEALHESMTNKVQVTVGWNGAAGEAETIPGEFLSPVLVRELKGVK